MKEQQTANTGVQAWDKVLSLALELPFVKVNRESFLRSELREYCTPEEVDAAIACPPAVLLPETLERIAKAASAITPNASPDSPLLLVFQVDLPFSPQSLLI